MCFRLNMNNLFSLYRKIIQRISIKMTQLNKTGKSVQDACSKLAVQQNDCNLSNVRGLISTLEQNQSSDANTASNSQTAKPVYGRMFAATPIMNLGSSSLRLAETQRHTDTSFKLNLSAVMKSQKLCNTTSQNKFQLESTDPSVPKRKSLPSMPTLGSPPLKPGRPPIVNLDRFGRSRMSPNDGENQ